MGVARTWRGVTMECRGRYRAGVAMVPPMACHGTPHGWNPMPRQGMPWGCHGMYIFCPFSRHAVECRGTTCGKTFHIFPGIPPNPPRIPTVYHGTLGLPWSAVVVTAGCHDTTRGTARHPTAYHDFLCHTMEMPWYAMGGTTTMPRKIQIV